MTTRQDLEIWLDRAREQDATHMIVVCDTFSCEDYPVFVKKGEDAREKAGKFDGPNMQKVMEVYDLSKDLCEQLAGGRVMNF